MRVTVLGSGDAFASGGRRQSSYLVQGGGRTFLMDAGPTVLAALKDAGVSPRAVDTILVSHLHGDHFGGIPFMMMEYQYEAPRQGPLTIAGPRGTEERIRDLFRAMYKEASARPLTYPVRYVTMEGGRNLEVDGLPVEPFAVPHQELEPSLGFRVRVDGKTVMYSGDSGWTEEFVRRSEGVDLFICECCYYDSRYDFHINYPELEKHRPRIKAKRLVLTHLGREVLERLDTLKVETARDGMVIDL
jgi:ribonuclease BN (tRNA processing enzyme)